MTPDEYEEENRQYWESVAQDVERYRNERLKPYREHYNKVAKHYLKAHAELYRAERSLKAAGVLWDEMGEYLTPDVCIEEMNERTKVKQ